MGHKQPPPPVENHAAGLAGRCFVAFQHVLPKRLLGRLVFSLSRARLPWLKNLLIRGFVWLYDVETDEADGTVPGDFPSFNAFFTRKLKTGARPVDASPSSLTSPADGKISEIGKIADGELIQAKGRRYTVTSLLGGDEERAEYFDGGFFATIYLAPYNYHRVHMPLAGRLLRTREIPGRLMSVNATTAQLVPNLFDGNQRVVCHFEGNLFHWSIVLVGALNVGSISLEWFGEIALTGETRDRTYESGDGPFLDKGATMGYFKLGSTAIVLVPRSQLSWADALGPGTELRMGTCIGTLTGNRPS
jgi:phosphatidylserine decarboxylase